MPAVLLSLLPTFSFSAANLAASARTPVPEANRARVGQGQARQARQAHGPWVFACTFQLPSFSGTTPLELCFTGDGNSLTEEARQSNVAKGVLQDDIDEVHSEDHSHNAQLSFGRAFQAMVSSLAPGVPPPASSDSSLATEGPLWTLQRSLLIKRSGYETN